MNTLQQTARTRKPKVARPKPQTCRLALAIGETVYWVRRITPGPASGVKSLVRLTKATDGTRYWVARHDDNAITCDCPDFQFRHEGNGTLCKHGKAIIAATGLLPEVKPARRSAPMVAGDDIEQYARNSLAAAIEAGYLDGE